MKKTEEQKAFEKFIKSKGYVPLLVKGTYYGSAIQSMFEVWQESARQTKEHYKG